MHKAYIVVSEALLQKKELCDSLFLILALYTKYFYTFFQKYPIFLSGKPAKQTDIFLGLPGAPFSNIDRRQSPHV